MLSGHMARSAICRHGRRTLQQRAMAFSFLLRISVRRLGDLRSYELHNVGFYYDDDISFVLSINMNLLSCRVNGNQTDDLKALEKTHWSSRRSIKAFPCPDCYLDKTKEARFHSNVNPWRSSCHALLICLCVCKYYAFLTSAKAEVVEQKSAGEHLYCKFLM